MTLSAADAALWAALPSVTVVVLNYNSRSYLEDCFQSLRALTYPPERLELLLVDNASTDGSVDWLRCHYPEVVILENPENYGFCKGNNLGVARARGDLVALLNPDMRVDPRWLLELVQPLLADAHIVCASSKILSWDGRYIDYAGTSANFYGFGFQLHWAADPADGPSEVTPTLAPCGGAMAARRQEFLDAGGFDEDFFAYYEDLDLGWRFWLFGYTVVVAPRSLAYHVHHGNWGQVADEKKRVLYERNALLTILKNYDEATLQKVWPAALLLLAERTLIEARVPKRLFRIGPAPAAPRTLDTEGLDVPPPANSELSFVLRQSWEGLQREFRQRRYRSLLRKSQMEFSRLWRQWTLRLLHALVGLIVPGDALLVPREALSRLVAADDVLALYPVMLAKRQTIQARRRRADAEVRALFGAPFRPNLPSAEYLAAQRHLERVTGIDQLFPKPP